ncbi:L-lactate dehydrogenase [Oscillochloris sp. ZM17-4]|nr:L-lactate dehydrogenase [Oscillochloris sp. ZM17-4]MBX0326754.1 L-lactate dehydrogenase [Oscillochloris sp. ZM17-4]
MTLGKRSGKVGLVGTGMVGTSFAYALTQRSLANELILVDADQARAEGEAMDLNHGIPFVRPMRIRAGDYADLTGADLVVVAAGANQRPGETRLDLLAKNAAIFREIIPKVLAASDDSVIVIATNPVDILTYISAEIAGQTSQRVIGSGTILDTARFRYMLGEHYGVDARSVHAYIIGEHGDSELAVWSLANIAGVRLADFVGANGQGYDQQTLDGIFEQTRGAAYEIIKRKRATYYAIGLGLLAIADAVLRNQHTVLTVSSPMIGQYGVSNIAISLPTIIGRSGIEEVLDLPLSPDEIAGFQQSAQLLQENLASLG